MEEIDLRDLLIAFKKRIGLFFIVLGVCLLIGSIYSIFIQIPKYQANTTVVLSGNEETSNTTITQSDITLNQNLVETYAEIVKSRRVLSQVIEELELTDTYKEISSKVTVAAVNDTEIIKITVKTDNPILSKNIANVTAKYFIKEVKVLYNLDNVNILDEAIEEETPYNINILKQLVIYFMVGVVLACGIIFIIFYFDRTIKTTDQIETKIELPILGTVQEYSKEAEGK